MPSPSEIEREKEEAGRASVSLVKPGNVVGLGTGSTAAYAVKALAERFHAGLQFRGVPTSVNTRNLATSLNIPLATLEDTHEIDITIDGADEFDSQLNLIKGGGGALLREKIVASASRKFVVIADSTKRVPVLGKFPLPVEVIPFARAFVARRLGALGAVVKLRQSPNGDDFITDEGHQLLDCSFGAIPDPRTLARQLADMPGVVEHGLFIGMVDVLIVARATTVERLLGIREIPFPF